MSEGGELGSELDARTQRLWDEMLDEFRALGGIADNIRLGEGRFGRGLFPADPSKPIRVHIPESLLVDANLCSLEDNAVRVGPRAQIGAREKAFLENYERDFSWGVSGGDTKALLQMIHDAPEEIRAFLDTPLNLDWWLANPTPTAIAERYLGSRTLRYNETSVIIPVVELANHGVGTQYRIEHGIGLSGHFSSEVLVRYDIGDPLYVFKSWGFAGNEDFALSLHLGLNQYGIVIHREDITQKAADNPFAPETSFEDGKLALSYLLLGHKKFPGLARSIFNDVMRKAGRSDAAEVFEFIQHINRQQFLKLIELSEGAEPRLGRLLRDVARYQLQAMSSSIGARLA